MTTPSASSGFPHAPFELILYLLDYQAYLNTDRFDARPSNRDAQTVYNVCNEYDRNMATGAWLHHWNHCFGRTAIRRSVDTCCVNMPFVRIEGESGYEAGMTAIISQCDSLSDEDLPRSGSYYNCSAHTYDQLYFLDGLRRRAKEITLERQKWMCSGKPAHFDG